MKRTGERSSLPIAIVLSGATVFAHHGNSVAYDPNKTVVLSGVVTSFVWTNPHGQVRLDVKDDKGNATNWGGELQSIGTMTKAGWTKNILKPGDQITVTGHPSKFGTPNIVVERITLPNGKEYYRAFDLAEPPEKVLQFFDAGAGANGP